MDTCEICKRASEDVRPISDTVPTLVSDPCCELLLAELDVLAALR